MTKPGHRYGPERLAAHTAAQRKRRATELQNGGPPQAEGPRRWPPSSELTQLLATIAAARNDPIQLTPSDVYRIGAKVRLPMRKMALLLGVSHRQLCRYSSGELLLDGPLARLLVILDRATDTAINAITMRVETGSQGD